MGQIRPWCSIRADESLSLDSFRAGRMRPTVKEGQKPMITSFIHNDANDSGNWQTACHDVLLTASSGRDNPPVLLGNQVATIFVEMPFEHRLGYTYRAGGGEVRSASGNR